MIFGRSAKYSWKWWNSGDPVEGGAAAAADASDSESETSASDRNTSSVSAGVSTRTNLSQHPLDGGKVGDGHGKAVA